MQLIICVIAKIWRYGGTIPSFVTEVKLILIVSESVMDGVHLKCQGGRGGKENRMLINKLIFLRAADDSAGLALSWNGEKQIQMVNNCLCLHEECSMTWVIQVGR